MREPMPKLQLRCCPVKTAITMALPINAIHLMAANQSRPRLLNLESCVPSNNESDGGRLHAIELFLADMLFFCHFWNFIVPNLTEFNSSRKVALVFANQNYSKQHFVIIRPWSEMKSKANPQLSSLSFSQCVWGIGIPCSNQQWEHSHDGKI